MTTIYGYVNHRFFQSNPHGTITWYRTEAARDKAKAKTEATAAKQGLANPVFEAVSRVLESDEDHAWWEQVGEHTRMRGFYLEQDEPTHVDGDWFASGDDKNDGPVTMEDIRCLRAEAAEAGNSKQVAACDLAIAGDKDEWEACKETILWARQQKDG